MSAKTVAILEQVQPMRRSYAHRRSGATRRAILKAALGSFASKGFAASTLDDVHRRSGISIGSIYHHFGSKEQIGGALYVEGLRDYQESIISALMKSSDARTAIRSIIIRHLDWIRANPAWSEYLFENRRSKFVAATELEIRQLNQNMFREVGLVLNKYRRRGEILRLPLDVTIAILIGPAQQFARMWLEHRAELDISVATNALADAAWRSIRSPRVED
jgi:AcrR family transcriptional regulator